MVQYQHWWKPIVKFVLGITLALLSVYAAGRSIDWLTQYPLLLAVLWALHVLGIFVIIYRTQE
jgi:hypothetical protein